MAQPGNTYIARKLESKCTYPGCTRQPGNTNECDEHAAASRRRAAKSIRRRRAKWRRTGKCTRCGGKRSPASTWGCARCLIDLGRGRSPDVSTHVDKSNRIAAQTAVDKDGRSRFHGQGRRGVPPRSQTDEQDLLDADKGLTNGRNGLRLLADPIHADFPRAEKRRAEMAALDHLASACRFIEEVLDRHHYDAEIAGTPRKIRR